MWHNSGDHAVKLKDSGDFEDEGWEICGSRGVSGPRPGTNSGDFDNVGPGNEEGRVVLPLEGAFEEVSAGTVGLSVDGGNPSLGDGVVDLYTLCRANNDLRNELRI